MKRLAFFLTLWLLPRSASAAEFEFALIPSRLYSKFESGDFDWADIIYFGLHLVQLLMVIGWVVAVILLMYGGYQIIIGAASEDKEQGKNTIKYTIAGILVIALSWFLVDFVINILTTD